MGGVRACVCLKREGEGRGGECDPREEGLRRPRGRKPKPALREKALTPSPPWLAAAPAPRPPCPAGRQCRGSARGAGWAAVAGVTQCATRFRGRRLKAPRARRRRRLRGPPNFCVLPKRKRLLAPRRPPHTQRLRPSSMCCPCRGGGAEQGKNRREPRASGRQGAIQPSAALRSLCRPQAGPPSIAPPCTHRHHHRHVSTGEHGRKTGRLTPLARYQPHYPLFFVFAAFGSPRSLVAKGSQTLPQRAFRKWIHALGACAR